MIPRTLEQSIRSAMKTFPATWLGRCEAWFCLQELLPEVL
jgi:hypothetical protein